MEDTPIDRSILIAAKNGSVKAFEAIFSHYQLPILNYVYRLIRDRRQAEDLTQDTFIKVYRNIRFLDVDKSVRAWIYKIATNTTYDWLRRRKHNPGGKDLFLDANSVHEANVMLNEMDVVIDQSLTRQVVDRAMSALPDRYRVMLLLHYVDHFSYKEIGEMLHLPLQGVKSLLFRARKGLKRQLEGLNINIR